MNYIENKIDLNSISKKLHVDDIVTCATGTQQMGTFVNVIDSIHRKNKFTTEIDQNN